MKYQTLEQYLESRLEKIPSLALKIIGQDGLLFLKQFWLKQYYEMRCLTLENEIVELKNQNLRLENKLTGKKGRPKKIT